MKKGDLITHGAWYDPTVRFEAVVCKVEDGGVVLVNTLYQLDETGKRVGAALNKKQRFAVENCALR